MKLSFLAESELGVFTGGVSKPAMPVRTKLVPSENRMVPTVLNLAAAVAVAAMVPTPGIKAKPINATPSKI